jgi:hypothetical protein
MEDWWPVAVSSLPRREGSEYFGPSIGGVGVDVASEFANQVGNGGEAAARDKLAFDLREPDLDLIEPGRVTTREVKLDIVGCCCRSSRAAKKQPRDGAQKAVLGRSPRKKFTSRLWPRTTRFRTDAHRRGVGISPPYPRQTLGATLDSTTGTTGVKLPAALPEVVSC